MKINISSFFCLLSIWVFLLQQVVVGFVFSPIKLYMVWTALLLLIALICRFKKYYRFLLFEYAFVLFCMLLLLTILWANAPSKSITLLLGVCLLLVVMLVYRGVFFTVEIRVLSKLIEISFFYYALISIGYYVFGLTLHYLFGIQPEGLGYDSRSIGGLYLDGVLPRLRGLAESPNNFGLYMVIGISYLLFTPVKKWLQLVIMFGAVLLTFSITTYIMVMVLALFYIFTSSRGRLNFISLCLFFCFFILFLFFNVQGVEDLIRARMERVFTGSGRFELWSYSLALIEEKPFFGYGLNQSRVLLEEMRGYQSTHNAILEVLITGGIFLLFSYTIFWVILFTTVFKLYLSKSVGRFLFPLAISYFVSSMSNVVIFTESFVFMLTLIAVFSVKRKVGPIN